MILTSFGAAKAPATNDSANVARPTIVSDEKLYSSGYAGGPLFVYDPTQPWTLGKGGPPTQPPPSEGSAASNPRRIGEFRATRVAIMHSSALSADGKIYFGGFGERNYTGGGLV